MSSPTSWRLTPHELLTLWPVTGVARFPFPLQVRDTTPTLNERDLAMRHATARLQHGGLIRDGRVDADLEAALRILAAARLWCTAFGFHGTRTDGPSDLVRIRAAHAGRAGVLAVQLPGPQDDVGGDVLLRTVPNAALAESVVGALPPAPPGRERPATTATGPHGAETAVRSAEQREDRRFRELVAGPFTSAGQLSVTALAGDGHEHTRNTLRWFDREDDGRYLADHTAPATVRPADAVTLTAALQSQLTRCAAVLSYR
ncbi:ESX secretion-associated protein EspG [Rhodococcus sp. X156]|uniref:ESX secretion-associated protein EspG n=1 Tax=Rhodococcus sp. X156 TaxID=2499145 RepID=UPI0013E28E12|nr:ESX secretion-associated protein EspG [Rhodococcus sp. X156]